MRLVPHSTGANMHENRPVLLFDIDDVLAFFLKGFWEQVAIRYPQVIVPSLELCDSYNLCTPESGLTPEMMHSVFAQPHFSEIWKLTQLPSL